MGLEPTTFCMAAICGRFGGVDQDPRSANGSTDPRWSAGADVGL